MAVLSETCDRTWTRAKDLIQEQNRVESAKGAVPPPLPPTHPLAQFGLVPPRDTAAQFPSTEGRRTGRHSLIPSASENHGHGTSSANLYKKARQSPDGFHYSILHYIVISTQQPFPLQFKSPSSANNSIGKHLEKGVSNSSHSSSIVPSSIAHQPSSPLTPRRIALTGQASDVSKYNSLETYPPVVPADFDRHQTNQSPRTHWCETVPPSIAITTPWFVAVARGIAS